MGATWARHGHGMGTAWARHGHGMLWMNRPLVSVVFVYTSSLRMTTPLLNYAVVERCVPFSYDQNMLKHKSF